MDANGYGAGHAGPRERIVAIIQARMGSTRLPGKVLMDLAGWPVLTWVTHRVSRASAPDALVVATTSASSDDIIAEWCRSAGIACFRGSEEDVLDRYHAAARAHNADIVLRITADCPFVDPSLIDRVVAALKSDLTLDYSSNILTPRTFPRGLDVEAMRMPALERAWREDRGAGREHVTPYIYRNPDFSICGVREETQADLSVLRWTLDTADDLAMLRTLAARLPSREVSWRDILAALEQAPWIAEINSGVAQKSADLGEP